MVTQIIVKKFTKDRSNGYWYLLECNFCHRQFEKEGYKVNEGKGSYCSKTCYGKANALFVKCATCNKEYYKNHDISGKKYCSQACMAVAYKNNGNPCWRGGVSRLPYHHTFKDHLKKRIRERDNYTCAICSKSEMSSFDAHVHHINGNKLDCSDKN